MPSKRLQREYPNLATYLEKAPRAAGPPTVDRSLFGYGLLILLAGRVFGGSISDAFGIALNWITVGSVILALACLGGFLWQRRKTQSYEPTPETKLLHKGDQARNRMLRADNERNLLKGMDPAAMDLLEAGAKEWNEVRQAFGDHRWSAPLPDHWKSLRQRALAAANLAMAQLTMLCADCYTENPRSRKADFEVVFEQFGDLDFADAMQRLTKVFSTDSNKYKVSSPRTREIFGEARDLIEQLRALAEESNHALREARFESTNLDLGRESVRSVLDELRFVRTAEAEIENQQEQEH